MLCLVCVPFEPLRVDLSAALVLPLLWLAIVISVIGQLLLYRLIRAGKLVDVTSLFYLVPIVTAALEGSHFLRSPSLRARSHRAAGCAWSSTPARSSAGSATPTPAAIWRPSRCPARAPRGSRS
jgi:hypothetical protein